LRALANTENALNASQYAYVVSQDRQAAMNPKARWDPRTPRSDHSEEVGKGTT
jgi:hypothetical protein